ncbi:MAG: YihY/virulence factor BrkB family protein [Anaerolineaceae bacterium]|nr:YihY/virulence factor BrkB family protein [Anaerolineaceae bacterium]
MNLLRQLFDLLKTTFKEWNEDKVPRLAAALAYYTAFSIAPLLIVVIAVIGLALGQDAARTQIISQIQGELGQDAAQVIQTMIESTSDKDTGIWATLIGIVAIVLGAAGFFGQLQDALNTIWEVTPKPGGGIIKMVKERFFSFTMVLGIAFLLLVSLMISSLITNLSGFVGGMLPGIETLVQLINFLVSFLIITLLFALIYKVLPDVTITWRDVWIGAAMTALLFNIGKFLLGLYVGNTEFSSTYGAAGSIIVLLVWVYYTAQILMFGAEFTQVYARRYGSRIRPSENAVYVTEEQRAQEGMPNPEIVAAEAHKSENRRHSQKTSVSQEEKDATSEKSPSPEESPQRWRWSHMLVGFTVISMFLGGLWFREKDQTEVGPNQDN